MRNKFFEHLFGISFLFFGFCSEIKAQISVYDCNAINSNVIQSDITAPGLDFYQTCITFPHDIPFNFSGPVVKNVKAATQISIEENFHAGPFDQNSYMHFSIEDQPTFDVAVLNYNDLKEVQKFKKLEFGINISGDLLERINNFINPGGPSVLDALNPFLEKDVDIGFKFTHVATGTVKLMDAFFYEEYVEANDWVKVSNPYPIRARFAPPLIGEWKTEIFIEYRENYSVNWHWEKLPEFYFDVVESGHPGFVKVHSNHTNFERGGQIIFPFGHTLPTPYNGVDIYSPSIGNTNKAASVANWQQYRGDVENYISQGGKFLKTTQAAYSSLIEFEEKGNYYNRLHYAWEQDKILDLCEENDILLLFNLLFQEPIMKVGQYVTTPWDFGHWDILGQNNVNETAIPYCYYEENKEPYEMFMNDLNNPYDDIYYHQQRSRYYISRYGYSPQIYNFELLSEPWHLNESYYNNLLQSDFESNDAWYKAGTKTIPYIDLNHALHDSVRIAVWNYHDKISRYIKEHLYHTDHLIGIQSYTENSQSPWTALNSLLDYSTVLNNVDVIGINRYDVGPNKLLITEKDNHNNQTPNDENSYYKMIKEIHDFCDKPVIFSEAGAETSCDALHTQQTETMTLGFTGVAGGHMWAGYSYNESNPTAFDERLLWPTTIRCATFYNENTFTEILSNTNGYWIQGRQSGKRANFISAHSKELQYYISEDRNDGIGYIRNRTYNDVSSSGCNLEINSEWENESPVIYNQGQKLEIHGMNANIDYIFHWYPLADYTLYNTYDHSNGLGKIKKFPHHLLSGDNYILWFRIKRDYSQKIDSSMVKLLAEVDTIDYDDMMIYPNPVSQFLTIESNDISTFAFITDIQNKLVTKIFIQEGVNNIDLSNLSNGVYFLQTDMGLPHKIIKQ